MRLRLASASLALCLTALVAGCSSGGSDASPPPGSNGAGGTTTTAAGDTSGGATSDDGGTPNTSSVDCEAIKAAQQDLLSIQLMAQIRDPESIATLKSGTLGNLDIDHFLASMKTLHQLDPYDGPLGNPKEAISAYEEAATDLKALLEADPVTQEAIDAYNAKIGSVGEFLGHQTAIAGGLDAAGC
jgi:hypothetical protein